MLYVGGTGTVPGINGNVSLWFVQRSTDGGQTWSVDDTYQKTAGLDSVVNGLAVDNAGNVFACGVAMQSAGPIWTVRKRDLNGNWMIVQAIIGSKSSSTLASSIAIDPNAGIFVIGNTGSGGQGYGTWSTYRSADAGATWNLVDSFNGATAHALATYPGATASTICAVGYGPAGKSAGGTCWYVRMSNDNGAHWNTVDNFQYAHGTANNDATGVAFDSFGNVFTSGCGEDTAGVLRWVMRTRLAGTSQWQISDEYQYPNSTYNAWTPRLTSASGTVIAAGIADDSSDTEHWITRTLQ